MSDLYVTLGVPKDADRAAIRAAYRKRAKSAHPDGGGTPKQFALIKIAHDTLTDDLRRSKYDETGEFEERPVDNGNAKILEVIASAFDAAMSKVRDPIKVDMVAVTKSGLRELRGNLVKEVQQFERSTVAWRAIIDRLSVKGEAKNPLVTIITPRIDMCVNGMKILSERIGVVDQALAALDDVSFRFDREPEPEPSPAQAWMMGQQVSLGDMMGRR